MAAAYGFIVNAPESASQANVDSHRHRLEAMHCDTTTVTMELSHMPIDSVLIAILRLCYSVILLVCMCCCLSALALWYDKPVIL